MYSRNVISPYQFSCPAYFEIFFNCLRHLLEPRILFSEAFPFLKAAFFHPCLITSKMPEVELMALYYMASSLPSLMTAASETGVSEEALVTLDRVCSYRQKQSTLLEPFESCIA